MTQHFFSAAVSLLLFSGASIAVSTVDAFIGPATDVDVDTIVTVTISVYKRIVKPIRVEIEALRIGDIGVGNSVSIP